MKWQRIAAIPLFVIGFAGATASHIFPLNDYLPEIVETLVVWVGVACVIGGVALWVRSSSTSQD
uniref:Uncharacterized protein n=1 Tax=Actinoplanes italicus TaxID=113567 RepID=A0A2T0JLX1_9ACTN|nr:hypothetical protein [Actinoplanes italicus]PRX08429.1 hypothetical protein CLV67_14028 [Actinoplanes italicus]GIE36687.1 hypothetical protein Ait01nite_097320 [Actinoplanes italicus]